MIVFLLHLKFLSDAQNFVSNTIPNASLNVGIGSDSYDISIGNAAGDLQE